MDTKKAPKCKTCPYFTRNKSGICDNCLEKKYDLCGERYYDPDDCLTENPLIPLDVVLMILDKVEVEKNKL